MIIKEAKFIVSSPQISKCPVTTLPEYAFIGRSNVGKSTLINMLTMRKGLAKTSARPGKTQLINHFLINDSWYLVDLPGYGWARISKTEREKWEKMIRHYFMHRENLACVFLLIDSRHEPLKIDTDFMEQLVAWQVPFALVFTKSDKQSAPKTQANIAAYRKYLKKTWEQLPPFFVTSGENGQGRDELLNYIQQINDEVANPTDEQDNVPPAGEPDLAL